MKFEKKSIRNWNLTEKNKVNLYEPKNLNELKFFFKNILKENYFFIRTGNCSYGDKSISLNTKKCLSLKYFNKILSFDKNKGVINVQAGTNLYNLSKYLFNLGFYIYNIPGGKSVSLGGAISGNVHGRISNKKFSTFGDNIISITVLGKNLKLKKINKNHKSFFNIIGGMGMFETIVSAEIKVQKLNDECFAQSKSFVKGYKKFEYFFKKTKNFYGFLDLFNENLEGIFFSEKLIKKKFEKNKFGNPLNLKRLGKLNFLSFFVNLFTLKMIYKIVFLFKKNSKKESLIKFGEILYPTSLINILPIFFKNGMIEIQLSINPKNFVKFHKSLVNINKKYNFYFYYILLKKMHKAQNKFFTNFPKYQLSLTLSFSKKQYLNNPIYFQNLKNIISKFKCEIYVTKDEIMLESYKKKILNKSMSDKIFIKSQMRNVFREKLLSTYIC